MKSIKPSLVLDVSDLLAGGTLVQISIGPAQELLVLSFVQASPDDRDKTSPTSGPLIYRIHRFGPAGWELAQILAPSNKYYSFVQPLPHGRWLLVGSRASANDLNADIFGGNGIVLSSFHAGDGIEHVQTTSSGETWIGYFDEGVFGLGELGQSGLVCLNDHGEPLLHYWRDIAEPNGLPGIDDCYSLNVPDEESVWTAYYSNFPLVSLHNKKFATIRRDFPAKAVKSFAIDGEKLLMVAAYRKEGLLYSVNLRDKSLEEIRLLHPLGNQLSVDRSVGRGSILLFACSQDEKRSKLYAVDLRSLQIGND